MPGDSSCEIVLPVKRYTSINEVSKLLGVSAAALRYWERRCPSMRPLNFDMLKRRRYSGEELLRIVIIHRLIVAVGMKVQSAADLAEKLDVKQFWSQIDRAGMRSLPNSVVTEWILDALSVKLQLAGLPLLESRASGRRLVRGPGDCLRWSQAVMP